MTFIKQKNETFFLDYEIKVLILGISTFILAIGAGFLFNGLLYGSLTQNPSVSVFWILTAVAFLGLVAMLAVISLVIRQNIVYLFFVATSLALIFPIAGRANIWHWLAVGILFLWMTWSRWQIRSDLEIFLKPKTSRILSRGIKKLLSGLIIFISVFYFFSLQIQQSENLFISQKLFETVLVPIEKLIQSFVSGFKKGITVDEAILEITANSLFNELLKNDPLLRESSTIEIENYRQQFYKEFKKAQLPKQRQELSGQLGITLKGNEKIADIFYNFALAKFRELPASAKTFFDIFITLGLFFFLRIAAIPFGWLTLAAGSILFKILLIAGFVSIKKQMIEKEFTEM